MLTTVSRLSCENRKYNLKNLSLSFTLPFKTTIRTVNNIEYVIVEIVTDTGDIGYGEAPSTRVITGDTTGAIIGDVNDHIKPKLIDVDIKI